jgi:hypothetical protein
VIDRHRIWREAKLVHEHLEAHSREGYAVVGEIHIHGREEPLIAAVIETHRDLDYDWVKLYMGDEDGSYAFVRESLITRIEVAYRPVTARLPVGFQVRESPE